MRKSLALLPLGLGLLLLLLGFVAATHRSDINEIQRRDAPYEAYGSVENSDSISFINSDSESLTKTKSKSVKKPTFLKHTNNTGEANLKARPANGKDFERKLGLRSVRNVESNEDDTSEATTVVVLENSSASNVNTNVSSKITNENDEDLKPRTESTAGAEESTVSLLHFDDNLPTTMFPIELTSEYPFEISSVFFDDDKQEYASTVATMLQSDAGASVHQRDIFGESYEWKDAALYATSTERNLNNKESSSLVASNVASSVGSVPPKQPDVLSRVDSEAEEIEPKQLNFNNSLDNIDNANLEGNETSGIPPDDDPYNASTESSTRPVPLISHDPEAKDTSGLRSLNLELDKDFAFLVRSPDNEQPCILASMNITLLITYYANSTYAVKREIQVPTTAEASGSCGEEKSRMTLAWSEGKGSNGTSNVTFIILNDGVSFFVDSLHVNVSLGDGLSQNSTGISFDENSASGLRLFSAYMINGVHVCHAPTEVSCGSVVAQLRDVSLIAFNKNSNVSNRREEYCTTVNHANIAVIAGGTIGVATAMALVASYGWYKKRANTFRSELP